MTMQRNQNGFAAAERQMLKGRAVAARDLVSLADWFPVALSSDAPPTLWWRHMAGHRFTKPFFQDDLQDQAADERQITQTGLAALRAFGEAGRSVAPTAFIFHVSRCGSTLLTQMLAASPCNIVVSEPPVLDAFFRHHHAHPDVADAQQHFRLLVAALGQRRSDAEQHFFVKLDSWHIPWIPFVRQVFPDTPMVLVYRDPAEVLASHRRQRGPQMIPGLLNTSRLETDVQGQAVGDLDAYCLGVLVRMYALAGAYAAPENLTLVNYRQLPEVLWTALLPRWGVPCQPQDWERMQSRARFHSKEVQNPFAGDAHGKLAAMAESTRAAVHQLYEALEGRRARTSSGP